MAVHSAGILLFRRGGPLIEVLLVHPGGPFWARRDAGAWSVPKGEIEPGESPEHAALREFREELGSVVDGERHLLGEIRQASGKRVTAFAVEGEFDPADLVSTPFSLEWPPRSGKIRQFPEVDRVQWFDLATARQKIIAGQQPLLDRLQSTLAALPERAGSKPMRRRPPTR